jgi:hypothetical protein
MSKKKGKAAARKAPKKKTAATAKSRQTTRSAAAGAGTGTTSQVTIYLFRTGSGNKIRTAPQKAYAGPGHVEWTVVNLIDGTDVPVRITWPNGSPWSGEQALEVKSRHRMSADGVKPGVYKYVVHAYDAQEDPEIEFPQN